MRDFPAEPSVITGELGFIVVAMKLGCCSEAIRTTLVIVVVVVKVESGDCFFPSVSARFSCEAEPARYTRKDMSLSCFDLSDLDPVRSLGTRTIGSRTFVGDVRCLIDTQSCFIRLQESSVK